MTNDERLPKRETGEGTLEAFLSFGPEGLLMALGGLVVWLFKRGRRQER